MRVELAVGMKAMVVLNIAKEADLVNRTRGTVQGLVLDPREDCLSPDEEGHIHLKYPPPVIYFKPDIQTNSVFEGVPEGVIPVSPSMLRFSVDIEGQKVKLERRQLSIVPALCCICVHRLQVSRSDDGICDSRHLKTTRSLSPFSVYVALSRSRGRKTIRILRDFDPALFMHHPSEDLRKDMIRLEHLDERTKEVFEDRRLTQ